MMQIEFLGPQPQNANVLALPLAVMFNRCQSENGKSGIVFAVSFLCFNVAWWIGEKLN